MHFVLKRWRTNGATAEMVARAVTLTALLVLAVANSVFAGNGIMLQIKDAPLREVVMLLTQQSGCNIVIADDSKLDKRITATLNDVPLEKALDHVVKGAGVSYRKTDDGTYIIGGVEEEEPVLSHTDVASALPPVVEPVPEPKREGEVVVIKLIHSRPSELLRLIGWTGVNPIPNCEPIYPSEFVPGGQMPTRETRPVSVITQSGAVYDPLSVTQPGGQPVVPTIDPASLYYGAGRTADQFTGAGQYPNTGARVPGYTPTTQPRGVTAPTTPGAAQPGTGTGTSGSFLWPDGVQDARPFDLDNSIIVKGDEEGIEKFKKIVRMLDVPPKQVSIKAEFIEVSTTDIKRFGIDWSLERLNESFSTAFGPTGNVIFGFASGNLTAQLKTQLTTDIGRVINSPIISTINNQNAQLAIQTIIPYWDSVTVVTDNQSVTQPVARFINVSTMLNVMPRVNGDGTITMILMPQVSDTGTEHKGPQDAGSIPEQRMQSLFTQRRVANGETIVVGGFIRKNDSNNYQKIPILGDLPIVGGLFRTHAKTIEDRELLIFITPTIIGQSGMGTLGGNLVP